MACVGEMKIDTMVLKVNSQVKGLKVSNDTTIVKKESSGEQ